MEDWKYVQNDIKTNGIDLKSDSITALEIQEMQEEEKYIQALRNQREKVELFRNEVIKKDLKIKELENLLKENKQSSQKIKEFEEEIKYLAKENREKDQENYDLRQKMRKQVEDYENSLKEVQLIVFREREERNNEIKALKKKVVDPDEYRTLQNKIKELETKSEIDAKTIKEKDKQAADSIKAWKSLEKILKDQVSELSNEKYGLQEQLQDSYKQNSSLLKQIEKLEKTFGTLDLKKFKDFQSFEQKEKEIFSSNLKLKSENQDLQEEIFNTQEELNKCLDIITRQEASIVELRAKSQESFELYEQVQSDYQALQKELQTSRMLCREREQDLETARGRFEKTQKELDSVKARLDQMIEKDNLDKAERQKNAKIKTDLLNQRALEVKKLSEAIQSFTVQSKFYYDDI
jgi:hypothetical protein